MPVHAPYRIGGLTSGAIVSDPTNTVGSYTETRSYTVHVDGLPDTTCELARREPTGTEVGTILFASASDGSGWSGGLPESEQWMNDLAAAGWRIVQCRWPDGWHNTSGTLALGPIALAGRVASVVRHVRATWATAGNLLLCGGSGGSSQFAYALSFYGVGSLVAKNIPMGGPVHSSIVDMCVGSVTYAGDATQRSQMDDPYESTVSAGPCQLQDATARKSVWAWDSLLRGNLNWPPTTYVWGTGDTTVGPAHGELLRAKQPFALRCWPNGTPHFVLSDAKGRAAVENIAWERPFIRQSNPGLTVTGTSLGVTLGKAVKAGNLLVVAHKASTGTANMTAPSGFTLANGDSTNAETVAGVAGIRCYWKIAAGGEEAGLAVGTATSVLQAADIYEIEMPGGGTWSVDKVDLTLSTAGVTTLTAGPTNTPTTAKQWCLAMIGTSGGFGSTSGWTNGYVQQASDATRRFMTAARSIHAAAATSTAATWGSSTTAAAILVTFKTT